MKSSPISELFDSYGDVKVKFCSYYKYTFSYSATLPDGKILVVRYGDTADDIYRHEVTARESVTVNALNPYGGSLFEGEEEIEQFD